MRTNGTYRSPVHGVSTLAPRNRMRGQAGKQVNFRSDPVNKLTRRPPSMFEHSIFSVGIGGDTSNSLMHSYQRNGKTYTLVIVQSGTFDNEKLYRLFAFEDGVPRGNIFLNNLQEVESIKEDTQLVTIEDTTFILNKKKVVESIEVTDTVPIVSYLNVISALNYGETIELRMRWRISESSSGVTVASYTVPDLGDPPDYDNADKARATNAVATGLRDLIQSSITAGTLPLTVHRKGSVVAVKGDNTVKSISLEIVTGQGDRSITATNAEKQDLEGLPLFAVEGSRIKVKPRPESDRGTYYLQAELVDTISTSSDTLNEVVWVESRSTEGKHKLNNDSMPTIITVNGTVSQTVVEWEERKTGDDETNKVPGFVGNTISAIGTHQNRLILVSGNTVTMSRTDNLFNLFKQSATRLLVTDPAKVDVSATNVDKIDHVVPHNRDIIFNSRNAQFKLDGNIAVTPETISIPQVTAYDCQTTAAPVPFGNSVLFPITYGSSSGVLIYNKDAQVESDKATQITNHIQGMMTGKIKTIRASSTLEMCVILTTESNEVFVYEQYTEFDEARQKSWSTWEFPEGYVVHDCEFINNKLRFLLSNGPNMLIWSMQINTRVMNDNDKVHLDNMVIGEVTSNKRVTLPVGAPAVTRDDFVVVMGENTKYPLSEPDWKRVGGNDIDLSDDPYVEVGDTILVGLRMKSSYIPTRPFRWTEAGIVVTTDKLRISRFTLSLVDTAEVSMRILSDYYDDYVAEYNSRLVGGLNNLVGVQPFTTGDVQFSFGKEADLALPEFYTEGYLPLTIAGISWFGQYHEPSRRM